MKTCQQKAPVIAWDLCTKKIGCAENIHGKTQLGPGFRFKDCQFLKKKTQNKPQKLHYNLSMSYQFIPYMSCCFLFLADFHIPNFTVGSLGPGCLSHPKMVHRHLGANSQWIYQGHQKMCNQRCCSSYLPRKLSHGTQKWRVGRWFSFSNRWFSGSMLVFGGVTIQLCNFPANFAQSLRFFTVNEKIFTWSFGFKRESSNGCHHHMGFNWSPSAPQLASRIQFQVSCVSGLKVHPPEV